MLRSVFATAAAMAMAVSVSAIAGTDAVPKPMAPLPRLTVAMQSGDEVLAPYAFYDFCRRTPYECQPEIGPAPRVELTPERWAVLNQVNDIVNKTIIPMSDWEQYGVADYWAIATKYGDCEKYALTKQLYLRQRGWPMNALLMTVVFTENGEGHAVLTVRTSRGDLVLDNRQPSIVAWAQTPYTFVKRQSTVDPKIWVSLNANPLDRNSNDVATTRPIHGSVEVPATGN